MALVDGAPVFTALASAEAGSCTRRTSPWPRIEAYPVGNGVPGDLGEKFGYGGQAGRERGQASEQFVAGRPYVLAELCH